MHFRRSASRWLFLALGLAGCVDDVTVVADDRARRACEEAPLIAAPASGCTTLTLTSNGPWGCGDFIADGGFSQTLAGTWVRLHRDPAQAATLRLTWRGPCETDGGTCQGLVLLRHRGGTPCTCGPFEVEPLYVEPTTEVPLAEVDTELLLGPFGTTYDVSLCDASLVGP